MCFWFLCVNSAPANSRSFLFFLSCRFSFSFPLFSIPIKEETQRGREKRREKQKQKEEKIQKKKELLVNEKPK